MKLLRSVGLALLALFYPVLLALSAVSEQLFGRHKPYGMPVSGYIDDVKKLGPAHYKLS